MLKIKQLTKQFNEQIIIDHLSLTFYDTGFIGIVGKSGCGKSTLLHILANIDLDYEGELLYNNQPIDETYKKETISYLMQENDYINALTVKENILLPVKFASLSYEPTYFDSLVERFNMKHLLSKYPNTLSGGEKKRMSIIKALLKQSKIILCDEPTGPLDQKNSREVMALLKEVSKDHLVIMVSHNLKLTHEYCDSVLYFKNKKLEGEVEEKVKQEHVIKHKKYFNTYFFKQLLFSKYKLLVFVLFVCLSITSSFLLVTCSNGILNALSYSTKTSVTSNMLKVENNNRSPIESLNIANTIDEQGYSLELLAIKNNQKVVEGSTHFLPHSTSHIKLKWGHLPTSKNEVVVTASFYKQLVNNDLELSAIDLNIGLNVVGVVEKQLIEEDELYLSLDLKDDLSSLINPYQRVIETKEVRKNYNQLSKKYYVENTALNNEHNYKEIVKIFKMVGYIFTLVSIIMSISLIMLIFKIIIEQRVHDLAYLMTLGVCKKTMLTQSILEALSLGLFVSTLGCLICIVLKYYLNQVYNLNTRYCFSLVLKPILFHSYDFYIMMILLYTLSILFASIKPNLKVINSNLLESIREG